jgi:hypothetical protein
MFDYANFVAMGMWIRTIDPFTEHDRFTVLEGQDDLDPAWKDILKSCSEVKADVLVREYNLIINVEDDGDEFYTVYTVRYKSTNSRQDDADEFSKRYRRYDPALVDGILKLYRENEESTLYENRVIDRIYFGIRVGNNRVYEGCAKV